MDGKASRQALLYRVKVRGCVGAPRVPSACDCAAQLAEHARRFDEMLDWVRQLASLEPALTAVERDLFSTAVTTTIGSKRASWRSVKSIEAKERARGAVLEANRARDYASAIASEVAAACAEVLHLISDTLMPHADEPEARVFLTKMQADHHRYIAEVSAESEAAAHAAHAQALYDDAWARGVTELHPMHPLRLALALNRAAFAYEIRHDLDGACALAREAFDDAVTELDAAPATQFHDASLLLQLLRDNLAVWTDEQILARREPTGAATVTS